MLIFSFIEIFSNMDAVSLFIQTKDIKRMKELMYYTYMVRSIVGYGDSHVPLLFYSYFLSITLIALV